MDIKSIKDKILQLAIQGKLVKQDENDEPAKILLKKITEEKERLINEKKIKREKPMPEITKEEKAFELPKGWEWVRLGDVISISSGKNLTKKHMCEKGSIPVYGGNGITGYHSEFNVEERTVVIGRVGFYCGSIHLTEEKAWVTDNAFITNYENLIIDRDYLVLLLRNTNLNGEVSSTAQPVISGKKVYPVVVAIPPLEEQQRIVAKVDELFTIIDELSENKESMLKNITDTRNKVLQLAIQGKLVEQCEDDEPVSVLLGKIAEEKERLIKENKIKKEKPLPEIMEEERLFDLPNGWEWCRLGNIANIIMGQSPDSASVSEDNDGIEFHQGKTSFGKYLINKSGLYCTKPTKIAVDGDVLLSVRAPVGTLNITDREICIGRGLTVIRSFYGIETKFYYYFIKAFERELVNKATGTTFLAVSSGVIKELLIPLPPLEEQKRIFNKVDEIVSYLDKLEKTMLE